MDGPNPWYLSLALAVTAALAWASLSDLKLRKIPNSCVLTIVALFALWAALRGGIGLQSSLIAAAISFTIGFGLYRLGVMGAGDVKLFSALALFAGLELLGTFALSTAISGGLVALSFMIIRPTRGAVMFALKGKGDYGPGIPYGIAISLGALLVIWGSLTHMLPLTLGDLPQAF